MIKPALTALALLVSTVSADAASRVWITEFATSRPEAAAPFAQLPASNKQPALDISSGLSKRSGIFASNTRYIRIVCEVQCAISMTAAATVNDILLPALRPEYFGVSGGTVLNVIAAP